MRCVYSVGVLTSLVEDYGVAEPDILIAVSGSAGGAVYYLSGQYRDTISTWLSMLPGNRFISFRRRKVLDIDYLVDEIFKKKYPLDFKTLASAKTQLLVAVTRVNDGKTLYLEPPRDERVYEYLRATKAVPVAYGKRVLIDGVEYVDGDFGADTEDLIQKALELGAEDIIVIESNPYASSKTERHLSMNAVRMIEELEGEDGMVQAAARELVKKSPVVPPTGCRIVSLAPSNEIHIPTTEHKKSTLRSVFNLGYADTANNEELRKLFV